MLGSDGYMNSNSKTCVVVCFDDYFAPAACVMLTSLFINNVKNEFGLYALTSPLSDRNRAALLKVTEAFRREIRFIQVEAKQVGLFRIENHFSPAAYYRLLAPKLLSADKILYFDVDLIVQADIRPLLELDVATMAVAAALDNSTTPGFRERLGISQTEPYVNTGVLVMNAKLWREERIFELLVDYYTEHGDHLLWADQDLLNAALAGKKLLLEQSWNMLYGDFIRGRVDPGDFSARLFDGVFHYNTWEKPWYQWSRQPFKQLYQTYAAKSPAQMRRVILPRDLRQALMLALSISEWSKRQARKILDRTAG